MGEGTSHIEWAQEGPIQPSFNRSIAAVTPER